MIYVYIYLAVFAIMLAATLWSYKGNYDMFGGFWYVLKECLFMSILWVVFLPTGILIWVKKYKQNKSKIK